MDNLEKIVSLCKRRGFIFPSSEIYGGFAAVYDYGPYGVELSNAIKREWWRAMVQSNENIVGLDSAIFMAPKIWEASGHVGGFADPLTECKKCHMRFRVDHLLDDVGVFADEKMSLDETQKLFDANAEKIVCKNCGGKEFTQIKKFNQLVVSNLGNFTEDWKAEPVYLRGETAQGIYVNFKNVASSCRVKIPFGIAQIGKAFRNEITARQFIFRTREFEQMEMQYFVHPSEDMKEYEKWKEIRWQYYLNLGLKAENLKWHKHENLVFYAKEAFDIEYNFPFGFKELEGIHARGNYDLTQHTKFSGKDQSYSDPVSGEKYLPHVVETSAGVARTLLAILCEAYHEEEVEGEVRVVMKFLPKLAPIKIAVLPLSKKDELSLPATEIFNTLKKHWMCEFDETQSIGKRYRRQDEIGTPFCITFDFESITDKKVTVRERDTMTQERVAIDSLVSYFQTKDL